MSGSLGFRGCGLITMALLASSAAAEPLAPKAPAVFATVDTNRDGRIGIEEYLAAKQEPGPVAVRDFHLFDLDGNGRLSAPEFALSPTFFTVDERGPLLAPSADLALEYLQVVDKHWPMWDVNEDGKVSIGEVVRGVSASREPRLSTLSTEGADENSDRFVTRDEMHRLFEKRLGLRRERGELLRRPNGLVFNYQLFRQLDTDRNDKVSEHEWQQHLVANAGPDADLRKFDGDRDGSLSFAEFWDFPGGALDTLLEFRRLDADLDVQISPAELLTVPEHQQRLAELLIPAFDQDGDRRLSLREYLITPLALPLLNWWSELTDTSDDGRLSFGEFTYENARYPLLRREYFRRFDLNTDGHLDPREFAFRSKQPNEFFTLNADGTGWRKLCDVSGQRRMGSPAVSPDGSLIAFSGTWQQDGPPERGDRIGVPLMAKMQGHRNVGLFVMARDGTGLHRVGVGMFPSWTADSQFLLAHTEKADVRPLALVPVVPDAIVPKEARLPRCSAGARLSPDGLRIAYAGGGTVVVVSLQTEEAHGLLSIEGNPYKVVGPSVAWSPDSSQIVFVGHPADGRQEIAVVNAEGAELGFRVLYHDRGERILGRFAWRPDGETIVFAMHCPERDRTQLYELSMQGDVRLFPGQDANRNNQYAAWMPDGTRLIVISGDFSAPEPPAAGF